MSSIISVISRYFTLIAISNNGIKILWCRRTFVNLVLYFSLLEHTYFTGKFSGGRSHTFSALMAHRTVRTHPWGFFQVFYRQTAQRLVANISWSTATATVRTLENKNRKIDIIDVRPVARHWQESRSVHYQRQNFQKN